MLYYNSILEGDFMKKFVEQARYAVNKVYK